MATHPRRTRHATAAAAVLLAPLAAGAASAAPLQTLFAFDGANGFSAEAPLLIDGSGNLFGTTAEGGSADRGVVFELSPPAAPGAAWTYAIVHNFGGADDGADILGGLSINGKGVLFGTSYMGGAFDQGAVYMIAPPKAAGGAWSEHVLFSFGPSEYTGYWPVGGVLIGAKGVLYGTTSYGGPNEAGTVFALVPPTPPAKAWTENVLYYFQAYGSGDAYSPQASLIADAGGNLYGTTVSGGAGGYGAVFELSPAAGGTYTESVIYSFQGSPAGDGSFPAGPLLLGPGGVLYGTTAQGGTAGAGTVFELTPGSSGWTEQVLYSFANNGIDGIGPQGTLVADSKGRLYGVTPFGGSKTFGTLFRLAPKSAPPWSETILHDFTSSTDGATPHALSMSVNGTLYGATSAGGAPADGRWGYGTIFDVVP